MTAPIVSHRFRSITLRPINRPHNGRRVRDYGSVLSSTSTPVVGTLWERVGERDADAPPFYPAGGPALTAGERLAILDGWIHPVTYSHYAVRAYPRSSAQRLTAQR